MTAPASWLVYDALLDFFYAPADQTLRLLPQFAGSFPVVHPLFWAVGTRTGDRLTLTVLRVFTETPLMVRFLETDASDSIRTNGVVGTLNRRAGVYVRHEIEPFALLPRVLLDWEIMPVPKSQ